MSYPPPSLRQVREFTREGAIKHFMATTEDKELIASELAQRPFVKIISAMKITQLPI